MFPSTNSMTYALSFDSDFYLDQEPATVKPSNCPTCVYQAILSLSDKTWNNIARDVFQCDDKSLSVETVLAKVVETNTCSNLDSPVQVWIDKEGWYDVLVYDNG